MSTPNRAKGSIPTLPARWARGDVGRAIGAWIEAAIKQALSEAGIHSSYIDGTRIRGTVAQGAAKVTLESAGTPTTPAAILNFVSHFSLAYVTSPEPRVNITWSATLDDLSDTVITSPSNGDVLAYNTGSGHWVNVPAPGGGTVTSVALTAPSQFSVAGSPVTASGTLAISWQNQSANRILAGPTTGAAAAPTFRALVSADLPAIALDDLSDVIITSPATGAVLKYDGANWIDDTDTGFANPMTTQDDIIVGGASGAPTRLAKGSDGQVLTVDPTTHHLVWATPASGSGTVTSVALAAPSQFAVSGSPVTVSGTLTFAWNNQTANTVLSGPTTGAAAAPTFRALVANDYVTMVGDSGSGGTKGAAPAPSAGDAAAGKYLKADATWGVPSGTGISQAYTHVQDEGGSSLTQRDILNFVGPTVQAEDDGSSKTRVRIDDPAIIAFYKDEMMSTTPWTTGGAGNTTETAVAGHVGAIQRGTGASPNTGATMYYPASNTFLIPSDNFDCLFILKLGTNDSNTLMRFGLSNSGPTQVDNNAIFFEKLAADTSWFGVCRSGGSQNRTSAVSSCDTNFHSFRIRRVDASTIGFSIDGGTEQTQTSTIPTAAMLFWFMIANNGTSADKNYQVDYVHLLVTGLSR